MKKIKIELLYKILLLCPVLLSVIMVLIYSENVPCADEWGIVSSYKGILDHGLKFQDLFVQHNEHRIFFPRIILLISAICSNWNVVVQMLISQIMLMVSAYLLYSNFKLNIGSAKSIYFLPIVILLFSFKQYENMLWGFQVGFYLVLMSAIVSFYFYEKYLRINKAFNLYLAILFGIISSFSSIQGLLVWICYLVLFIVENLLNKSKPTKEQIIIMVSGLLCWILYFWGYVKPGGHPDIGSGGFIQLIEYFLVFLGGNLSPKIKLALLFGIIYVVLLCYCLYILFKKNGSFSRNIFPCLLILFGLSVCGSVTLGRAGFGVVQASTSRYTSFSILVPIGIYFILSDFYSYKRVALKSHVHTVTVICLSFFTFYTSVSEISSMKISHYNRKFSAYALLNYEKVPTSDKLTYFPFESEMYLIEMPRFLKEKGLSVFSPSSMKREDIPLFVLNDAPKEGLVSGLGENNINIVEDKLVIDNMWVLDGDRVADSVYIKINNNYYSAYYGIDRIDVADHFNNKNLRYSGFKFAIPTSQLEAGENNIEIIVTGNHGNYYYKSESFIINI